MSELARMAQEAQRQYEAGETEEGGFAPEPAPMTLQESIQTISANLSLSWQTVRDAFTRALQPAADALSQWWKNLGKPHKKRPSRQTRAFLATKHKPTFTPHAQRRRRSQRRRQVYCRQMHWDKIREEGRTMNTFSTDEQQRLVTIMRTARDHAPIYEPTAYGKKIARTLATYETYHEMALSALATLTYQAQESVIHKD